MPGEERRDDVADSTTVSYSLPRSPLSLTPLQCGSRTFDEVDGQLFCRNCSTLSQSQSQVLEDTDRMSLGARNRGGLKMTTPNKKRKKDDEKAKPVDKMPTLEAALLIYVEALKVITEHAVELCAPTDDVTSLTSITAKAVSLSKRIFVAYLRAWKSACASYPQHTFNLLEAFLTTDNVSNSTYISELHQSDPTRHEHTLHKLLHARHSVVGGEFGIIKVVPSVGMIVAVVHLALRHLALGSR